ncbi:prepilin-type N-terminal cleavage/methylation domain-containing protein [Priestia flexa]|uniref:prepilin-type N-terminal cleavage/methylation domain-containing protein n=1 Tax=Priestia flexa TaxID=86664 RepID=UPI001EF50FDA|nr:prepilin-type N-terminal cleavage/methylation domain-containing protein [Priestia flexa]MCG7311701.1 prepilin-type N-terminal cleavage/methylation domain-containing protein [Priestia flexa]
MMKKFLKNEKGLTLIELLAVIVILGIIAAIAIPSIGGIIQKSREDAVKADALQAINSAKVYMSSNTTSTGGSTTTITSTQLEPYLDVENEDFTVTNVIYDGSDYKFNGTGKAGSVTLTFTNATTKQIKADNKKGTRVIGDSGTNSTADSKQ